MTMEIDLNNPVMGGPFDPEAKWKRAMIIHLGNLFNLRTLIETGTSTGDTIEAVKSRFDSVLSVELSVPIYEATKRRFATASNVHLFFGSSGETLPLMIAQTQGPLLFWLDAHGTGGQSVDSGDQIPMEFNAIRLHRPESLVLIDDMGPDSVAYAPPGWEARFFHGMLMLHAGNYDIPERF